jgi:predicted PurR-regulated permease PerM
MRRPLDTTDGSALPPHDLTGLFAPPRWLRDLGRTAWLAVGVTLFAVGVIWLLSLTDVIVTPVITAAVVSAVAGPVVSMLERRRLPRAAATAVVLLALIALGVAVVLFVLAGITSQLDDLRAELSDARDTLAGWATDAGVSAEAATNAKEAVSDAISSAVPALLRGIGGGLSALSSLVVFLALATLCLFFLLKDGPLIRRWAEGHLRMPAAVAHGMGDRVVQSLRGYFFGVTMVALFNAVVVVLGALLLGVPQVAAIAAVTFLGAYVPYLGAWSAGIFVVLIALGGQGADAAAGMIVVQLLANGILQQVVQPIAYGAALGIHPLAVLVVTMAGGALFGAVGLILAAPLTAAATRIAEDLAAARSAPPGFGDPARAAPATDDL